jgi:hypothetical protein
MFIYRQLKVGQMNIVAFSNRMKKAAGNSTFAIGGVSCSADSLVQAESFVLRIKFSGKKPAHRKSAKRYVQFNRDDQQ